MIKLFIVASIIIILLAIALSFVYSDYYHIEKFTLAEDADARSVQNALQVEETRKLMKQQNDDAQSKIMTSSEQSQSEPAQVAPAPEPQVAPAAEPAQVAPAAEPAQVAPAAEPAQVAQAAVPQQAPAPAAVPQQAPAAAPQQAPQPTYLPKKNIVDFLAVISAYKPWGIYYAGNFSENKLYDLLGRNDRNAITSGNINKSTAAGFGANGTVKSILGTTSSYIEWNANSIPEKFTICSITRYTGNDNNKRILTARNATVANDWIHGHKNGKRGVVYYTEYKTNSNPELNLTGNTTDWVVTCAKNDVITPNNIYINGIASGIKSGGQGGLRLAINKLDDANIIAEQSDFALSYIIIWDTNLTNTALEIVSDSLMNYLNTGEELLFDTNNLSIDDKLKVIDAKSNFFKYEINELSTKYNTLLPSSTTSETPSNPSNSLTPDNSLITNADKQVLYSRIANLENTIRGQTIGALVPSTNVITLNLQSDTTDTTCVNIGTKMPDPTEKSFTDTFDDTQLNTTNTDQRPYIWCNKCNVNDNNNTSSTMCKAYDVCKKNYSKNNKVDNKSTFTTISEIDKQIYDNCVNAFINFPKYLQANSDIALNN